MANNLLPVRTSDGQATGVPGLRVLKNKAQDLTVGMVGSTARLTLRANTHWRRRLPHHRQEVLTNNSEPLWDSDRLTAAEQASAIPEHDQLAWLGSGLLRRIGIFHTVSTAYKVKGIVSEGLWTIDMGIHPDISPDHNAFVTRLTNPVHGLPLTVDNRTCTCGRTPPTAHSTEHECRIELRPQDPQLPGRLQLRFQTSTPPVHLADTLKTAGADQRWLTHIGLQRSPRTRR